MIYVLIAILFLLLLFLLKKREGFEEIELIDWWVLNEKEKEKNKKIFTDIIQKPAKIYSVFGTSEIKGSLNIQYSGESTYRDPSLFHINFIPANADKNIIVFPYAYYYMLYNNININELMKSRTLDTKSNFCLFSVSNCNSKERIDFFKELTKYKKIDSCGSCMNNIEKCPGNNDSEYFQFINKYKFMICFENKSQPNYFTEKIINAYYGKTIPIYWGCPNVNDYINMDAILYLKHDFTKLDVDQLIEKIKVLDNDDFAYNQMFQETLFKKIPDEFNMEKIKEKVNRLI